MPKTAIVTGSSKGIGRAIALRLARDGARLVLCARNQDSLAAALQEIEATGARAIAVPLDLRTPDSAPALVSAALAAFGQIDIVVNNAGATRRGDFAELTDDDWTDGFA